MILEAILSCLVLYVLFMLTGFPFLFLCAYRCLALITGRVWTWDKKRKLLALNAVLYPLLSLLAVFALVKAFGIERELMEGIKNIEEKSNAAIAQGDDPARNNALMASIALASIYLLVTMVVGQILGFIYALTSTVLLMKTSLDKKWWMPFLIAILVASFFILLGYLFRTPIYNSILEPASHFFTAGGDA